MIINFDYFNKARKPSLILCNHNGEELFSLKMAKNKKLTLNLNGVSELDFEVPKLKDGNKIPYYGLLQTERVVYIENLGRFLIKNVDTQGDGILEYKQIKCYSLEHELSTKTMSIDGTYKFYDPSSNDDTIMNIALSFLAGWSIGDIDPDLWFTKRNFEIYETNVYNFLMEEAQMAYDCIFYFDTLTKTISAKKVNNALIDTDIFLSYRNLIKNMIIEENGEDIITALDVYGDGDLSINLVNPLGTSTIYDFSYFKNHVDLDTGIKYMSQGLIDALTIWETKITNNETIYANLLTEIKALNTTLITYRVELTELETQLAVFNQTKGMMVANSENLTTITTMITNKNLEITNKKTQITNIEITIATKQTSLKNINTDLSFLTNFTDSQWIELSSFIKQQKVQYTEFSKTELTTIVEEQGLMQELNDFAQAQLKKSAQPIYTVNLDVVGFLNLIEYRKTIQDLKLGSKVVVEIDRKKDLYANLVLLGMSFDLDNFEDMSLEFSSDLRSKSDNLIFTDLMNKTASLSTSYDFESYTRKKNENVSDDFNNYKSSALSLANQEITSSTGIGIDVGDYGIRLRKWIEEQNAYSPNQMWLVNNVIGISDNSFNGVPRMAIGEITMPDGTKAYGIIADSIFGNLMVSKKLLVDNESGTFKVDENGATLIDADFKLTTTDGNSKLILNSTDGIKMQGKVSGVFQDKFYLDGSGNANFKGNINGSIITGTQINGGMISVDAGNDFLLKIQDGGGFTINKTISGIEQIIAGLRPYSSSGARGFYLRLAMDENPSNATWYKPDGINASNLYTISAAEVNVNGSFYVYGGTKNALVDTEHYGKRLLYCEESDRVYFNTYGNAITCGDFEYKYIIRLDDIFLETIELNSKCPYHLQLTSYSNSKIWVKNKYDKYIIIQSESPTEFDYTVRCVRKGYPNEYLKEIIK